ncbi:MAG: sulfite exporter TauE/SafE family protein [Promethearchaeota archaeon]
MDPLYFLILFGICIFVGTIGVIAGFGGGIFIVPILLIIFEIPIEEAVANSLVALFLPSIVATYRNGRQKEVNFKLGLLFEIPTAIGAFIGVSLTVLLPSDLLEIIFGFLAFLMGSLMVRNYRNQDYQSNTEGKWIKKFSSIGPQMNSNSGNESFTIGIFALAITGFFIGIIAGMLGIGCGWITTPLMILGFAIPPRIATATATFMIIITSAVGGMTHVFYGHLSLLFIPLTLGLIFGSEIGTRIRTRIHSDQITQVVIISLFIIGFIMIITSFIL